MAIRLRVVNGERVALCAAKTTEEKGDIYLDDGWHYTISQKYWRDYDEIDIVPENLKLMEVLENEGRT